LPGFSVKRSFVRKRLAVAGYLADDLGVDGVGVAEADDGWGFAGGGVASTEA